MFFGPVYPFLVLAAMKLDARFAEARLQVISGGEHARLVTAEGGGDFPRDQLNRMYSKSTG